MTRPLPAAIALLGLVAFAPAALAAPSWSKVELETSAYYGGQPSGWPHFQTITITHEGEVAVSGWNLSASERDSGWATKDQMEALDRAVTRARLGRDMPAQLPGDSRDFTLTVESRLSTRRGSVKGLIDQLGDKESRLRPILQTALAIADHVVRPPRRDDVFVGRVDAGWRTEVVRSGGFRVEVQPRDFADRLEALDGAVVEIKGSVRKVSSNRYVLTAEELLSPRLETLRGDVDGEALVVSGRRVQLEGPGLAVLQRLGASDAALQGYVYEGPRGPRKLFATGVLARAKERDWPFEQGDELLLTGVRAWGNYVDAVRLRDGRKSWTRLDTVEAQRANNAGATGALSGLGQ